MLTVTQLGMHHGNRLLYDDVNLKLLSAFRYGVVGANGAGKTTLINLISGTETPSLGEINIPKAATVGILKQDHFQYEQDRIVDVVIQGKTELWQTLQQKNVILNQEDFDEAAGMKLAKLEETIANLDGYTADSQARSILTGLGIGDLQHDDPLSTLSGGYKLRVLLAQLLFTNPDIMLLDEPTNHLDIISIEWLKNYLMNQYRGLLLFISHDQAFLNEISTHILDIDYGEIRTYPGNYDHFMKEKTLWVTQQEQELQGKEKKIAHLQKFIDRFGAKASKAKQATSRTKMIERIELPDIGKSSRRAPKIDFICKRPSGKNVLQAERISKSFDTKNVLNDINFNVTRGQKICILGHNGIGKSTLLKILLNKLEADAGEFEWGHECHIGYFQQNLDILFRDKTTIIDWLSHHVSNVTSSDIRSALGRALFSNDEVLKFVTNISGGEKARLVLAKLMLDKPNILVLDEPTNHLDLESVDALITALQNYQGTLIFVSHNRYFVHNLAKQILAITEDELKYFPGTYHEFLDTFGADYLNQAWLRNNSFSG